MAGAHSHKGNLGNHLRTQPNKAGHLLTRDSSAPALRLCLGQVRERTDRGFFFFQASKEKTAQEGREACPHTSGIEDLRAAPIADQDGVEVAPSRPVATNDELLPALDAMLEPGARAPPCLLAAALPFGNNAFELLLPHSTSMCSTGALAANEERK